MQNRLEIVRPMEFRRHVRPNPSTPSAAGSSRPSRTAVCWTKSGPGDPVQLTVATSYKGSDPWQTTHQDAYARLGDHVFTGLSSFWLWTGETVDIHVKGQVYVGPLNQPPNYDSEEEFFGSGSAVARWAIGSSLPPAMWEDHDDGEEPMMPPDRITGINSAYLVLKQANGSS